MASDVVTVISIALFILSKLLPCLSSFPAPLIKGNAVDEMFTAFSLLCSPSSTPSDEGEDLLGKGDDDAACHS